MKRIIPSLLALGLMASTASAQQNLKIGLAEDPDLLDPTLARTFVGRIVFMGLCDKLIDIDKNLKLVPELATEWSWSQDQTSVTFKIRPNVVFHDGEKLDAEALIEDAVRMNLGAFERHRVNLERDYEEVPPEIGRAHV